MRVIMAKLKFRPLHDRVVVKRIEAEEKSKGGIIIPDTAKGSGGMLKFATKSKGRKVKPEADLAAGRGGQEFGHCAGQMFGQTGSGVGVAP